MILVSTDLITEPAIRRIIGPFEWFNDKWRDALIACMLAWALTYQERGRGTLPNLKVVSEFLHNWAPFSTFSYPIESLFYVSTQSYRSLHFAEKQWFVFVIFSSRDNWS